jgi:predicted thioesterase
MIEIGTTGRAELVVAQSDTAEAIALGPEDHFPPVFATSRMVALMELAAARLMKPQLEDGQLSVGVSILVRHNAATPVGCRVHALATFEGMEGKLFRFSIEAFDEAGSIGEAEHTRAIIATERLLAGAAKRKA